MLDGVNGICDEDLTINDRGSNQYTHPPRDDIINNPLHYKVGGFEAIDVIKAKLTPEEYRGYCKGNVLKYVMRANYKDQHDNDCEKAEYYAKELSDALGNKEVR